jgi:hypothetical protein
MIQGEDLWDQGQVVNAVIKTLSDKDRKSCCVLPIYVDAAADSSQLSQRRLLPVALLAFRVHAGGRASTCMVRYSFDEDPARTF